MKNKYYIPKCFVKWLNEKAKYFETWNYLSLKIGLSPNVAIWETMHKLYPA